jgi:hypothetical protein
MLWGKVGSKAYWRVFSYPASFPKVREQRAFGVYWYGLTGHFL